MFPAPAGVSPLAAGYFREYPSRPRGDQPKGECCDTGVHLQRVVRLRTSEQPHTSRYSSRRLPVAVLDAMTAGVCDVQHIDLTQRQHRDQRPLPAHAGMPPTPSGEDIMHDHVPLPAHAGMTRSTNLASAR